MVVVTKVDSQINEKITGSNTMEIKNYLNEYIKFFASKGINNI